MNLGDREEKQSENNNMKRREGGKTKTRVPAHFLSVKFCSAYSKVNMPAVVVSRDLFPVLYILL